MTKREFLDKLRIALNGKVSASLVEENMTYYNEYIDSQIRMGRKEEEVMDMLGDPRLIARTIVQTNGTDPAEDTAYRGTSSYEETAYSGDSYDSSTYGQGGYNNNGYNNSSQRNEVKVKTIPNWLWAIIVIAIIVCIFGFIFSVVSFLLPFVLPILVVIFFIKLFRDWLN